MSDQPVATAWAFHPAQMGIVPDAGRDILPAGWYRGFITAAPILPTKKGDGSMALQATIELYEPAFARGRKIFANYNIDNKGEKGEQATKIGLAQLFALMKSVGVEDINQSTGELINKPFKLKLKVKPAQYKKDAITGAATTEVEYEERNEMVSHKRDGETVDYATESVKAPAAAGFTPPPAPAPAAVAAPVAPPPVAPPPVAPPVAAPAPVAAPVAPPVAAPVAGGTEDKRPPWERTQA